MAYPSPSRAIGIRGTDLGFSTESPENICLGAILKHHRRLWAYFGSEENPCNSAYFAAYWNLVDVLAILNKTQATDSRTFYVKRCSSLLQLAGHPATVQALLNSNVDVNAKK